MKRKKCSKCQDWERKLQHNAHVVGYRRHRVRTRLQTDPNVIGWSFPIQYEDGTIIPATRTA